MSAIVLYAPCMVWRGKKALEKNRAMNSNGKLPCTASDEPVFKAMAAVKPPIAIAVSAPHRTITTTPATPDLMRTPNGSSTSMKNNAWNAPNAAAPASRPTRMLTRDVGVASSRSKKPCSMSVASAVPPVTLPNSTPCTMLPAIAKSRKLSTFGKFGSRTARPNDELPSAAKNNGKTNDGMTSAGWRTMARIDRFDIAAVCGDPQALGLHRG